MQIRLKTSMAGPGGCHAFGVVLTVGTEIDRRTADGLIAGGYAETVGDDTAPAMETAAIATPENATAVPQRRRKG